MNDFSNAKPDSVTENAVVHMLATLFNDTAYMTPEDVRHNIQALSEGGFSETDRTCNTNTINYLISRFSLIFAGLLSNKEFRQAFIDAISMEQNLEDQSEEDQKQIRGDMQAIKVKNAGVATTVINFSHYDDEAFKKLNSKLFESFNKLDGYDDALDEIIDKQSSEAKEEFGFIVSNFAYLIRAFDKNTIFFAYVSSVLKSVQQSMNLEF